MFFHISFFCLILLPEMSNEKRKKGLVLLADGTTFYGRSAGIEGTSYGEICFNTGVTGYQEIFTDFIDFINLCCNCCVHCTIISYISN